jgi:hypothetical protein
VEDAQYTARTALEHAPNSDPALLAALRDAIKDAPLAYAGYLEEAAGCYAHHHYRATVLMVWNAVIEHLYNLVETLDALEVVNKRRHRDGEARGYRRIKNMADLWHVSDKQFIEMADLAGVIDRNVRTLLQRHIQLRDYCAHPAGYRLTERTAGRESSSSTTTYWPLATGGSNTADNIELRCAPCKQQKGGRI